MHANNLRTISTDNMVELGLCKDCTRKILSFISDRNKKSQLKHGKRSVTSSGPPTSKYKGVSFCPNKNKKQWRARVMIGPKEKHIGYYFTELEAGLAYDRAAFRQHGSLVTLNKDIYPGETL